jgi:tRNA A-37 threonylcarbamoyl transferase component Bud32
LHFATSRGLVEVSLLLLEAGAPIEAVTRAGETPLFVAAQYPQSLGCVRALCERGAEVDARDGSNSTPLIVAAHFGNEMVVRALLMAGADRSIMDDDDQTAMLAAENGGHMRLAGLLRKEEWPIVDQDEASKWNISEESLMTLVRAKNVEQLLNDSEELGSGFGGVVYLCSDHGAHVVVKRLNEDPSGDAVDATKRKMLLEEAKILFNLRHPHIVQMLAVSETPLAVVLEHAPLGSLDDVLSNFSVNEVSMPCMLWFCLQISSGLEYLHSERVFHRDLKASNVLVFEGFVMKIADFGFSRTQNDRTRTTRAGGTASHIAPECFDGKFSFASDVYSLAITFWEIATCAMCWPSLTVKEIMDKLDRNERPALTEVKEPLVSIIEQCWRQETKQRPTVEIVRKRLQDLHAVQPHSRAEIRAMEDRVYLAQSAEVKDNE